MAFGETTRRSNVVDVGVAFNRRESRAGQQLKSEEVTQDN